MGRATGGGALPFVFWEARCPEVISKCGDEDEDHGELEEGFVGFGFAVAAGRDPAAVAHPAVGAFDRPAVACERVGCTEDAFSAAEHLAGGCAGGDLVARASAPADTRFDPAFAQLAFELARVVAAVGPQLAGLDAAFAQRVDERQQMPALVLVAG